MAHELSDLVEESVDPQVEGRRQARRAPWGALEAHHQRHERVVTAQRAAASRAARSFQDLELAQDVRRFATSAGHATYFFSVKVSLRLQFTVSPLFSPTGLPSISM
jgi:hypothetical protein